MITQDLYIQICFTNLEAKYQDHILENNVQCNTFKIHTRHEFVLTAFTSRVASLSNLRQLTGMEKKKRKQHFTGRGSVLV